jgi:hypothetical protein
VAPNLVTVDWLSATGHSTYNAMQIKLQKTYSHGLSILSNYTWAKSIDDQSIGIATGASVQNPFNPRAERGPSVFDRTQRFVASGIYELPYGRGRQFGNTSNRAANAVLGGWQTSVIYTAETGSPFTVVMPCTLINSDGSGCRPNQVGNPSVAARKSIKEWFNPAAYAVPSTPAYGNTGRDTLRGPGNWDADIGIAKYFKWGDAAERRIQVRADMFNTFNHTNFGMPISDVTNPAIGTITSASPARVFQFGSRFEF